MRLTDEVQLQARALIASRLGLDFREGRGTDLERALTHALRNTPDLAAEQYLARLAALPDGGPAWTSLAGQLTVGETFFFRDHACFEALEQHVLPSMIAARRAQGILRLRLWSAGCATGEEPYSLAMLLDRLLPDRSDWALTILATDVNPEALEAGRRGIFREWSFRQTPAWVRQRYFRPAGVEVYELDPTIRRMVSFAPLNLAAEGYPDPITNTGAMDVVLCRNVLMYLTRHAQRATVARLQRALVPGGWLVVSPAEASADLLSPLAPVNLPGAVFYRKEVAPSVTPAQAPSVTPAQAGVQAALSDSLVPSDGVPSETATDLQRARDLADQGKLRQARLQCEAALARDRLDPAAHILLAAICQELLELPAALDALRRAIYLAPDSAAAHFLLAALLLRQGKRGQGRRSLDTVARLLSPVPSDEMVAGSDGLTAGRLLAMARAYLKVESQGPGAGYVVSGAGGPAPNLRPPTARVKADA